MIAKFINKKMKKEKREQNRINYTAIKRIKSLNNLPSLVCKQLQNRKYFIFNLGTKKWRKKLKTNTSVIEKTVIQKTARKIRE